MYEDSLHIHASTSHGLTISSKETHAVLRAASNIVCQYPS
jgi:hypothetical protein